jgi:hypothetical protein
MGQVPEVLESRADFTARQERLPGPTEKFERRARLAFFRRRVILPQPFPDPTPFYGKEVPSCPDAFKWP